VSVGAARVDHQHQQQLQQQQQQQQNNPDLRKTASVLKTRSKHINGF